MLSPTVVRGDYFLRFKVGVGHDKPDTRKISPTCHSILPGIMHQLLCSASKLKFGIKFFARKSLMNSRIPQQHTIPVENTQFKLTGIGLCDFPTHLIPTILKYPFVTSLLRLASGE